MARKAESQSDKFKQAARDLETDDDEKQFDKLLGKIAKKPKSPEEKVENQGSE